MSKIKVKDIEITFIQQNEQEYICLTDMAKGFEGGEILIDNWLRNKNTIEFLGVWERLNNDKFNPVEFDGIMQVVGLNRVRVSVKQWNEKVGGIGIIARAGKYGGTYAHRDIAFHFAMWLSPEFQLLIVKEFQRLKEDEQERLNSSWDFKRYLSKVNYKIHTNAVKDYLIPISTFPEDKQWIVYAEEADVINMALFGKTAKKWREENPKLILEGAHNMRDIASTHQLVVLANMENYNSILIKQGVTKAERFKLLRNLAIEQLTILAKESKPYTPLKSTTGEFDQQLKGLLSVPPPKKEK